MSEFDNVEFPDGKGYTRHGSPTFYKLLEEAADTHDRKSHDYASNDDPSGNYHFAGKVALLFVHSPEDAGFAGRIAEKIYRLANLESGQKTPKNESIQDTEIDIFTITGLWMADRRNRRLAKNRQAYNQFTGESRDIRDAFLNMAHQMTPGDMNITLEMLRSLINAKMGGTTQGQAARGLNPEQLKVNPLQNEVKDLLKMMPDEQLIDIIDYGQQVLKMHQKNTHVPPDFRE